MDELIKKYDELENIVDTLGILIKETTDKYYIDALTDIRLQAFGEFEDTEKELNELESKEIEAQNIEFENSRI